jgi:hypothetical protein
MWIVHEPAWLQRLTEGAAMLSASLFLLLLLMLGCTIAAWAGVGGPALVMMLGLFGAFVLIAGVLGAYYVTAPHPVRTEEQRIFGRFSPRRLVRLCLMAALASLVTLALLIAVPSAGGSSLLLVLSLVVSWVAFCAAVLLVPPALAFLFAALLRHVQDAVWESAGPRVRLGDYSRGTADRGGPHLAYRRRARNASSHGRLGGNSDDPHFDMSRSPGRDERSGLRIPPSEAAADAPA